MEELFKSFLENVVNLNQTRFDRAISSVDTITKILKNNSLFGNKFIDIKPQGSFRQETIIKPVNPDDDFDVDLMFEMKKVNEWTAKDYLRNLADEFKKLDAYKNKVDTRDKTRCVTIDYDIDFHVDIVPAITVGSVEMIMNKKTDQYEATDGDGYARWFASQNSITGGNLKKVVRLMKYVRDSKKDFEIKSVLLTTLLGLQVSPVGTKNLDYPDIHTSLYTLLVKLDSFLQSHPVIPTILNPALTTENFNRHWNPTEYSKFRKAIREYTETAERAIRRNDASEWQKIFGRKFLPTQISISNREILSYVGGLKVGDYSHCDQLSNIGVRDTKTNSTPVEIKADLYWGRADHREINRTHKGTFSSGAELPPHHWLKYRAVGEFEPHHRIYWQVVNTGSHAREWDKLRGNLEEGAVIHWEPSLFTGVHWIECFIIDSRNNTCVGRSGPFYVVFKNPGYPYVEDTWN